MLSGRADQVSGGDALVQVAVPRKVAPDDVTIRLGGTEITDAFGAGDDERTLVGSGRGARGRRQHSDGQRRTGTTARPQSPPHADQPSHRRPDLLWPAAAALRLHHREGPLRRAVAAGPAARRQPGSDRHSRRRRGRAGRLPAGRPGLPHGRSADRRLEQGLCRQHPHRLRVRHHRRAVPLARRSRRTASRRHRHGHDARRRDGAVHRPLGARHHQSVHLQRRHAGPCRRGRPRRARRLAVEPPVGLQLRRWRRHRPLPGHHQHGLDAAHRPARQGLRRHVVERHPHQHPLQPASRGRDRADAQGAHRGGARRARLHGGRGRIGRRHPAVRLRPEPPGADRRRHPPVLVLRHGHPDDPRRRLRAAGALLRRQRRRQPPLEGPGGPPGGHRPQRHQLPEEPVPGRDRPVERSVRAVHPPRLPGHGPRSGLTGARPHRVPGQLVRAHPSDAQPDVHQRQRHRQARPGHRRGRVDPLGRHGEHLRAGRRRVRPGAVGQRGRAVRPAGAGRRRDHAGRLPRPQRAGRELEEHRGDGARGLPVPGGVHARRTSTPGAPAT